MDVSRTRGDEQAALWNGASGQSWVEAQELLDQMFVQFETLLVDVASTRPRKRILDVGCGTGGTTLALAHRLGRDCECVGLDISEPMLELARLRAERAGAPVRFIGADAQRYAFEPGYFDLILSRFGVMFFSDSVRAFENLRRAACKNAELCVIAWRSVSENPFMTAAEHAIEPILPDLAARDLDGPGQFYFADPNRVRKILEESGWKEIDIRPVDVECCFPERELIRYVSRFGPLGRFLREADEESKARVLAVVRPAFGPYVHGDTVRFTAACWKIGARRSSGA